jgi:tRNA-splicing ligase RtcB
MVGVDIGCRMHLSVYAETPEELLRHRTPLFSDLQAVTSSAWARSGPAQPTTRSSTTRGGRRWA